VTPRGDPAAPPTSRIAIALGDPRGIGPEITARALETPLEAEVTLVGAQDQIGTIAAARRVPVGAWGLGSGDAPGDRSRTIRAGRIAGHAVEAAVRLALAGEVDAIVTAPAHKHALHLAGFPYPGHTEWLAQLAGGVDVAMMLAAAELRVVLVTTHVPFRDVPALLTQERVVRIGRITERGLREWWGLERPRLAVCAVNPHAGSRGCSGTRRSGCFVRRRRSWARRGRCRPIRSSFAPSGASSTRCSRLPRRGDDGDQSGGVPGER
jgi:4-hydroxythreonine-4-phosphate dehydrogenase